MKLEYTLSDKAQQQLLKAGAQDYSKSYRSVEFEPSDLMPEAREAWFEMFGTSTSAKLKTFEVRGGQIYDDGSVSRDKPYVTQWNWFSTEILTPDTVSDAILQLYQQYLEAKAELEKHKPKWKKARSEYEQKLAKEQAEEEAKAKAKAEAEAERKQRLVNLEWVKQLTSKMASESQKEAETNRFCNKFGVAPEDLTIDDISDKPYVRLSVSIPITIGKIDRTLEITNRTYHDIGENQYGEWESPEFSDLCVAIANAVAEIFGGDVETVTDYGRGIAYLNVVTHQDTINVATDELVRATFDC